MRRILVALLCVAAVAIAAGCGSTELTTPTKTIDMAKDEAAKAAILAIQTGIEAYTVTNGTAPPEATAGTLGALVSPWPSNPWTNAPMAPGDTPGDFTYEALGGTEYTLSGHLSGGKTFTRP